MRVSRGVPLRATWWVNSTRKEDVQSETCAPRERGGFRFVTPSSQLTLQLAPKSDDDPGPVVTAIVSVVAYDGFEKCDVTASVHAADPEPVAPFDAEGTAP